jgi:hypothetical protein
MADGLTGGCLCGAVRYEVLEAIFDAGYCHCSICRRSIGAPVLAWANVRASRFELRGSDARKYRSSSKGCRVFCGVCGSPIAFVPDDESGLVSFSIATLDDPEAIRPMVHMCHADKLGWFEIADDLPRFAGPTLPHPAKRS